MSGSNGRDKICAIVQYSVQLYTVSMRHSDELSELPETVAVGERITHSISQGRKIFKFLKFLEPLRKMHEHGILKKGKPTLIRYLSKMILTSAFFLYVADNMVWFANMGLIPPRSRFSGIIGLNLISTRLFQGHYEWRIVKDVAALWKNIFELVKYLFDALRNFKRQHDIQELLSSFDDLLVQKRSQL